MQLLYLFGIWASVVSAQTDGGNCTYAVEFMFIQDTSTSFDPWVELMQAEVRDLFANFSETYAEFKMGVASFVDKPMPHLGYGTYGGKPDVWPDYCYMLHQPLSAEPDSLTDAFADMKYNMASGGDWPEAPLDGLAYAIGDSAAGWSSAAVSEAGRPIVRVALVVTDYIGHDAGDADVAIHQGWEYYRAWENESYSVGGFGATEYYKSSGAFENEDDYAAMSQLFYKYDTQKLTDDEVASLKQYVDKLGPYPWPELSENPNDGADPSLCDVVEYISPAALGELLRDKQVVPVFVAVESDYYGNDMRRVCEEFGMTANASCLQKYFENQLQAMGVSGVATTMELTDLKEKIIQAVNSVTEMTCWGPPTTSPSTTFAEVLPPIGEVTPPTVQVLPPIGEVTPPTVQVIPPVGEVTPPTVQVIPPIGEVTPPTVQVLPPIGEVTPPTVQVIPPIGEVTPPTVQVIPPIGEVTPPTVQVIPPIGEVTPPTVQVIPPIGEVTPPTVQVIPPIGEVTHTFAEVIPPIGEATAPTVEVLPPTSTATRPVGPPEGTTTHPPTQPVRTKTSTTGAAAPPGDGGSNVGVIAGAAGGSVAGLAALGGLLYKKFGQALFRGSSSGAAEPATQVEVPENPVEREAMEEVTMDMFH